MGFNELENRIDEEILTGDEAKVREMLGGLKRVEAPRDFGFKVQARIASAKPGDFSARGGSWAFLKYAMPLGLVLVVISAFVINTLFDVSNTAVPVVADNFTPPAARPSVPVGNEVAVVTPPPAGSLVNSGPDTAVKPGEEMLAKNPRKPVDGKKSSSDESGGGSYLTGLGNSKQIIQPPGSLANRGPGSLETLGQIPVDQILKMVGINASFSDNGWKVGSVEANSIAERSGVKRGDLIEEINGQPVTGGTQFSGSFSGKSVMVKRDGKTQEIPLK
jgi:PDZ domain